MKNRSVASTILTLILSVIVLGTLTAFATGNTGFAFVDSFTDYVGLTANTQNSAQTTKTPITPIAPFKESVFVERMNRFFFTTVTATFTSSGTWAVPTGVTSATVYIYGGGGGGGGGTTGTEFANGGGGGGGATSVNTVSIGSNTSYTVTVGNGGTAGTPTVDGQTGGTSTFVGNVTGSFNAVGGSGGVHAANGNASATWAGGAGGSTGTGTVTSGGAGSSGKDGTSSSTGVTGTGGGGAGPGGNGGAAATTCSGSGGAGGAAGGGVVGGIGGYNPNCNSTTNSDGVAGTQPGGGGSGNNSWTTSNNGGAGGAGEVIVVYTYTPVPISGTKTVGPTGNYATLTAAFADLDLNGVNGATVLELQSTYVSTSETFPITPGTIAGISASNTVTVRPASGAASLSISSANTTATIDLNGSTFVTFDGQPGGTGGTSQLTLANTSTSGVAVRFINDAVSNTLQYCTIQGVTTSTTSGVVLFSTTSGTNGNSSNTIANCAIKAGASTPANGIYSAGTAAHTNNTNSITNNTIQDFFAAGTASVGILVGTNSSGWTITGNKLFQTATRTSTSASAYGGIEVLSSGNGFTVSNNTIGFASSAGTGTMTYTGAVASTFYGIELTVGTTTPSSVQGNTVTNISFTTSGGAGYAFPGAFDAIYLTAGNANIGTITGNTIGAATGNGAITVTISSTGGTTVQGIYATSTGTVNIQNNTIASFTVTGSSTTSVLYPAMIYTAGTGGIFNVSSNNIGSATASSITCGANTSTAANQLHVIDVNNTGAKTVNSNVINNITEFGSSTTGYTTTGISSAGSTSVTMNSNTITNISSAAAFAGLDLIGISLGDAAVTSESVTGNTIGGLSVNAASGGVVGMFFANTGASGGTISQNKIFGLSSSSATAGTLYGMLVQPSVVTPSGTFNIHNNMISVTNVSNTNAVTIYGILDFTSATTTSSNTFNYFYNSIYIGGSASAGTAVSYGFNSQKSSSVTNSDKIIFKDNILHNVRTGGTGIQYAISVTNAGTGAFTTDYNVFDAPTTTIGAWGGTNETFANWKTASAGDSHSLTSATFSFATPTTGDLHLSSTTTALSVGTQITSPISISTDYDGDTRSVSTPYIGADEVTAFNFSSSTYSVAENVGGGTVTITVNRTANTGNAGTVTYATSPGTATGAASCGGAANYVNTSGTLSFAASDTSKTFTVPVCSNGIFEADKTVNLTLSNATGSIVGSPGTAVLTVVNTDIQTFTLTYTAGANGSISGASPQTVNAGASGSQVTATPNTGYHFVTWSDGILTAARTDSNVNANLSVTATFAIITYAITASSGANGSVTPAGVTNVNYGGIQSYTITPDAHYHIADVLVDGVSVGAVGSYTFSNVTATHTISASFAIDQITVTFNANTGTGAMSPQTRDYNSAANLTANAFTKTGYTFDHWNTAADNSGTTYANGASYPFTASSTIYAQWTINTYQLTVAAGTGGSISAPGTSPVTANYGVPTTITAVANSGYAFSNWTVTAGSATFADANAASTTATLTSGNATVTANFAPTATPMTVTVTTGQSKEFGDPEPASFTYTYSPTTPVITFTGALTRDPGEAVGTYAITQGDLAATGYTITFVGSTFEIKDRTLSGTVTYMTTSGTPVPNVTVTASGATPAPTPVVTGTPGTYAMNGFGKNPYTITPTKAALGSCPSGFNPIGALDASLVAQHVVGLITLPPEKVEAGKVSGLNSLSSFDAALIAQYSVCIGNPINKSGTWKFTPATNLTVHNGSTRDFTGILKGDVSGNWATGGSLPAEADAVTSVRASVPNVSGLPGTSVDVPLRLENLQGQSVIAYQFDIGYDPAVIEPAGVAASIASTLAEGLAVVSNAPVPGLLKVTVYGAAPATGDGNYVNLRFNVIGSAGSVSPLAIRQFVLNDGSVPVYTTDGSVVVVAANSAAIRGRLLTATGQPVGNTRVAITSTTGEQVTVISSPFGYYEFGVLLPGETYTINAVSKRFTFSPRTVIATAGLAEVDLIAEP